MLVTSIFSFSCNIFKFGFPHGQAPSIDEQFNSLPNNILLDWSKLKDLADDKRNVTEKLHFVLGRVENIEEKRENGGYQHFSFSHNFFKRLLPQGP